MSYIKMDVLNGYKIIESSGIDKKDISVGMFCKPVRPQRGSRSHYGRGVSYPKRKLPARDPDKNRKEISDVAQFAWDCVRFIDSNGQILSRGSNPFSNYLRMKGENDEIDSEFYVINSPYSNGRWYIKVWLKQENEKMLVLFVSGNYLTKPINCKVEIYIPGDWEINFY